MVSSSSVTPRALSRGHPASRVTPARTARTVSLVYQARPDRHARLRERLITLSGKHKRYGYRMLHAKLVREGFKATVKVVERIYRED